MSIKKILLSTVVILSFAGYIVRQKRDQAVSQSEPAQISTDTTAAPFSTISPTALRDDETVPQTSLSIAPSSPRSTRVSPSVTATPMPMMASRLKNGRYTGTITDAFYGNVQVVAVVSGGRLTDVQFLDYPHDQRTSQAINRQATPLLKAEAIQAQSANVDGVSGATQTSRAFRESLSAALSQAQA